MHQTARELCLAEESRSRLRIVLEIGHHHLDGDVTIHLVVARVIDDTHRALTEPLEYPIPADASG
jgi:hypothetical protein